VSNVNIDVNCLVGNWPFRKLYKNTFEEVKKIHMENGITSGYVSSLDSIFYNDPFEGDEDLHEILKGTSYHHVLTINPQLPEFIQDVKDGIEKFDIKGVRIYPGYHGYSLSDSKVKELCQVLADYDLPLFVTVRMEDERMDYLLKPEKVPASDIEALLNSNPENKFILLTAYSNELTSIKEAINNHKYVRFDTSGLKGPLFVVEKMLEDFLPEKMVYGSLYPLYSFSCTYLTLKEAQIEESVKQEILSYSW
jgi:predicted TIM-barrel fold metal-dependent hydrolase